MHGAFCTGDRLPSEKELGDMFAISRQTVRQATSVLGNEGLLERRRGSGTYIASTSSSLRTDTMSIGVITTYLDDYIFPSIIKGIDTVLTQNRYAMQLSITYNKIENEMRILSGLLKNDVDGIIIEPTKSSLPNLNTELYEEIEKRGIPCIFINGYYPGMAFPFVGMDDYACGKEAARYLLQNNHTKIAGIFKSDDIQGHLRYTGCAKWLKERGHFIRDDNVMWYTTEDVQMFSTESFAERLLARIAGCSAIICYNDQIAQRIIKILSDHNLTVPGDFSIISFDNSNIGATAAVGLTTFSHPKAELGKIAAANLLRLIKKEKFDATVRFAPKLIERNSTRKIECE
jgi:GntR family transcriptional regulator of arabinose operon